MINDDTNQGTEPYMIAHRVGTTKTNCSPGRLINYPRGNRSPPEVNKLSLGEEPITPTQISVCVLEADWLAL